MPLIVPGVQTSLSGSSSSSTNSTTDWSSKLLGKKLGGATDATTFARSELPGGARVVEHGGMMYVFFSFPSFPFGASVFAAEGGAQSVRS